MEQSEDGTLFVKQNLELYIHRESVGSFAGRIVCGRLDMRYVRSSVARACFPVEMMAA